MDYYEMFRRFLPGIQLPVYDVIMDEMEKMLVSENISFDEIENALKSQGTEEGKSFSNEQVNDYLTKLGYFIQLPSRIQQRILNGTLTVYDIWTNGLSSGVREWLWDNVIRFNINNNSTTTGNTEVLDMSNDILEEIKKYVDDFKKKIIDDDNLTQNFEQLVINAIIQNPGSAALQELKVLLDEVSNGSPGELLAAFNKVNELENDISEALDLFKQTP